MNSQERNSYENPTQNLCGAGHQGMVGSAIVRQLQSTQNAVIPDTKAVIPDSIRDPWIADQVRNDNPEARNDKEKASASPPPNIVTRSHAELELTNQAAVRAFFEAEKPDQVYMAAARFSSSLCQLQWTKPTGLI